MLGLRGLDWRTIGVELVIVFVGLLAALQFDEWREEAERYEAETRYLVRLKSDLEQYRDWLSSMMPVLEHNRLAVATVYRALQAGEVTEEEDLAFQQGLIYVGMLPSTSPPSAAYEEMVASGMFAWLNSEDLKAAVAQLYAFHGWTESNFSWWRVSIFELNVQVERRVEFYNLSEAGGTFGVVPDEPERRVRYDLETLDVPEVRNGFYWAVDIHNDWGNAYRGLLGVTESALEELEQELEGR